jgi:hypothetical protein
MFIRPVILTVLAALLSAPLVPAQPYPTPWPTPRYPYYRPAPRPWTVPVYQLYNPGSGETLFTSEAGDMYGYTSSGSYQNEGVAFRLLAGAGPGLAPLYRLTTANGTFCLGTMTVPGYVDPRGPIDRTLGYISIDRREGWVALYEWYNPATGLWFYTTDPRGGSAPGAGYRYQHVVGYVMPA